MPDAREGATRFAREGPYDEQVAWIEELRAALGPERVRTDRGDLIVVSRDGSPLHGAPACLAYPEQREHVEAAMRIASEAGIPIVARGGGTSLAAGAIPPAGALVLAFNRMTRILELDVEERTALVQPGLTNLALDVAARAHGLRYAPDPSSRRISMIGGNVATNAGGLHCLAHGVTTDHVRGLEIVLADGTVAFARRPRRARPARARRRFRGHARGGHERVVTLLPVPEATGMVVCGFPQIEGAGAVAEAIVRAGLPASALEYIDETMLGVISGASPGLLPSGVEAALIAEVETLAESIDDALATIEEPRARRGGSSRRAVTRPSRPQVWEARSTSGGAVGLLQPDSYTHDFAVPRDRIVEVLRGITRITGPIASRWSRSRTWGTATSIRAALRRARARRLPAGARREQCHPRARARLRRHAQRRARIGLEKLGAMGRQFTPPELDLLRAVRAAFDPQGILNPDKAIPLAGDEARRGVFAHA